MAALFRSCINGATTMPYPLEEDVRAASAAGFEAVEIWQRKLVTYLEKHSVAELRRLLDGSGLAVAAICPLWVRFGDAAAAALADAERATAVAAEVDCPTLLVCVAQPPGELSPTDARAMAADGVGRAADIAATANVSLAIEPLGRHPLVPGPREAMDLVVRAGRGNLGLMLDTFHYYKSNVSLADSRAIPIERLLILHVNDCEDKPLADLRDSDRLYPTLGVIPAAEMLRPIVSGGYHGFASVEIFRQEYWERPVDEISRESKRYWDRLVGQVEKELSW